jgi:hypothetical protein
MTDVGGAFDIERVKTGLYYVIAELPGYLNATSQFTDEELRHPTPEVLQSMEQSFPKVKVEAAQTAQIVVPLQRGAAVSGTVSYDDGSPAGGIPIQLLHRQKDGKLRADTPGPVRRVLFGAKTDDLGRFRISGLAAGEVIVKCTRRQANMLIQPRSLLGAPLGVTTSDEQTLDIYSRGVFREKDAKPIKLTIGAEVTDADISIALSKLHQISGVAASRRDGHALNGGTVALLYADDNGTASGTKLRPDGSFHFVLVPEGDYVLALRGAGEGDYNAGGGWSMVQAYEDSTQLVHVQHDMEVVVQSSRTPDSQ